MHHFKFDLCLTRLADVPARALHLVTCHHIPFPPAPQTLHTLCHYSLIILSILFLWVSSFVQLDLCHSLLTAPLTRNLDAPSGLLGGSARDFASRLAALLICPTLGFDAYSSACVIGFIFYCF